jgi:hypothetical protein
MRFNLSMLRFVAVILFVIAAILFFASKAGDVALGFVGLGLACLAAADVKM